MSSCTLSMNNTLWDSFSIEVGKFVNEMEVRNNDWAPGSGSDGVLVVINRRTSRSGKYA